MAVATAFAQPVDLPTLFDASPVASRGRSAGHAKVKLNAQAANALAGQPGKFRVKGVPLADGQLAGFDLEPARLFEADSRITLVKAGGTTESVPLPQTKAWYGRDITGARRTLVLLTKSDGTVGAMVTGDPATSDTVIIPDAAGDTYTVEPASLPARDLCATGELVPADSISGPTGVIQTSGDAQIDALATGGTRQADLMLDLSYSAYTKLGSSSAKANDYVTQLIAAVGSIYRRDLNVELKISNLYIWTTADPFNTDKGADGILDTGDQLNAYQNYLRANRTGIDRDVAHLLNYNTALGGIAYVDTLGRTDYSVGVSNVYAALTFPGDINTYYWDTAVVSHEMGHNFGSPHTHCYSPPIDCCYVQKGCTECATATPAAGTLMSYCHLQFGKGGSMQMLFHPRVIDLIKNRVANAPTLAPYNPEAQLSVVSKETMVAVAPGDLTPSVTDGTDFAAVELGTAPVTHTFYLSNPGSKDLVLNGPVVLSGSRMFTIAEQPPSLTVGPGGATYFKLTFTPTVEGVHDGQISIASNDAAHPSYTFAIKATAAVEAQPQTYLYRGGVAIPDGSQNGVSIDIPISGVNGSIMDIDFAIDGSACSDATQVGLQHAYVGDLRLVLQSPSGTRVMLMDRPGGGTFGAAGRNFCGTVLDDESGGPSIQTIQASGSGQLAPPYSGRFVPAEKLSKFYGENANGTWKLYAYDLQSPDAGLLRAASLQITGVRAVTSGVENWERY